MKLPHLLLLAVLVLGSPTAAAAAQPTGTPPEGSTAESSSAAAGTEQPDAPVPVTWGISPSGAVEADGRAMISHLVEPGTVLAEHVLLRNPSTTDLTIDVYATDAFTTLDGGFDLRARDEESTGAGRWSAPGQSEVVVPAGGTTIVPVTITVPADAEPGDHAGAVVASITDSAGGLEIERRVGTRVYLRVGGVATPQPEIADLNTTYRGTVNPFGTGDLEIGLALVNAGNIRIGGQPVVTVTGPFGLELATLRPDPVVDLLPGSRVEMVLVAPDIPPIGPVSTAVSWTDLDSAGQSLTGAVDEPSATTSVWAWPIALLVVLGLLLLGGLVTRRVLRRRSGAATTNSGTESPKQEGTE